ncbi:hypothetical protein XPA_003658 [Xanthoria parietina]
MRKVFDRSFSLSIIYWAGPLVLVAPSLPVFSIFAAILVTTLVLFHSPNHTLAIVPPQPKH